MFDQTNRRIAAFLLGGFLAVAVVVGLMTALYPFAEEAYRNVVSEAPADLAG